MTGDDYLTMFFGTPGAVTVAGCAAALALSFLLGLVVAITYQLTFRGFTYSRSYIHSMVLGAMVTCMLIMAVGSNLARGIGILGTLAIIRFRTPLRDPRDAVFLFASLGAGIACGAGSFPVAIVSIGMFCVAAAILHFSPFASRRDYEGILRFGMKVGDEAMEAAVRDALVKYCSSYGILGVRDAVQGEVAEMSYQIRLLDPAYNKDLVKAVRACGCTDPQLILQRNTVEI